MSNVPKLRFSEFSGKWEKEIFKNLVKLQRGSSPRPIVKYVTKSNDGVNWIKIGDTKSNDTYINFTGEKITKEGALKSRRVNIGDIILSNSMSYGKPYILNIDGYIHDGWFVIKEYQNHFNKSYLFQILRSEWIQKQYKRLAAGGVVSNISSELVNAVKINLPLKEEQEKIASFLTSVDTKIEQLTKKESLLQEYKKGVMQKIFNQEIRFKDDDGSEFCEWKEKKLSTQCIIKKGAQLNKDTLTEDGNYIALNGGINPSGYTKDWNTEANTITISEGGNSCGFVNFVKTKFWSGGHNYSLQDLKESVNVKYLYQYLKFNEQNIMGLRVGSGLPNIQKGEISNLLVDLPCIQEQTKVANFLSSIDKKIENTKNELENTKEFKKALLQQMLV